MSRPTASRYMPPVPHTQVVHSEVVADIWAGQPVPYSLLIRDGWIFAAYYDPDRQLTVAWRHGTAGPWQYQQLPEVVGWDTHNRVVLGMDEMGCLHLSANMHAVTLNYYRTGEPYDPTTFVQMGTLVDAEAEDRVTYPTFLNLPDGTLLFRFRDGVAGASVIYFYSYSVEAGTWSMLGDGPWVSGEGQRGVYPSFGPDMRDDGLWFAGYLWREDNDVINTHDICASYTTDFDSWAYSDESPIELPLTLGSSEVVAPIPVLSGLGGGDASWDAQGRPILTYLLNDQAGVQQLHAARLEGGAWVNRRLTSLVSPVSIKPATVQSYHNAFAVLLKEAECWMVGRYDVTHLRPRGPMRPLFPRDFERTAAAGLEVNFVTDSVTKDPKPYVNLEPGASTWLLRWETGPNLGVYERPAPPPQPLRLIQVSSR